ncbi:tRNA lysidine(34) synthetase TilS [Bacillus timonensis]|nr:tRNA lysidine(34) synthetase TilS [Bacillus timonensis]
MLKQVTEFVKKHDLINKGSKVVVGVSGGPDSMALLHFLWVNKARWNLEIVVAHVDHMFRGKQSEEDLQYVRDYCEDRGIQFEGTQVDVKSYQEQHKVSAQIAARECRYQFFKEVMERQNATLLALGHHGDDQIETVLMRLTRGSTGISYAGIQVKRSFSCGYIIRPFLCVGKDQIEEYCEIQGIYPRIDPSNKKATYTRNRFRNKLLPFLKEENPNVHMKFQQFSETISEDQKLLQELTEQKMNTVIKRKEDKEVEINIDLFRSMPKPLQRRGIQLILNYLYQDIQLDLTYIHIEDVIGLIEGPHPSGMLSFPKELKVVRSYDNCCFTFNEAREQSYMKEIDVTKPNIMSLISGDEIIIEFWTHYPEGLTGNDIFIIDSDNIELPLFVRTRKNGDKMSIKGMNGSKKVKDIFIDLKVPRSKRELWPIVEDAAGTILWLPGLSKSTFEANVKTKKQYIVLRRS